jgi:hypothetical protein
MGWMACGTLSPESPVLNKKLLDVKQSESLAGIFLDPENVGHSIAIAVGVNVQQFAS